MRLTFFLCLLQLALWATIIPLGCMGNWDVENDVEEDDFLSEFGLPEIKDYKTKVERSAALKQHEKLIQRINSQFASGKKSWWDKLNSFADLPDDEVVKEKTGLKVKRRRRRSKGRPFGRGLIPSNFTDDRSEKYFDTFRYSRGSAPRSYSAVDEGIVSPIRNQKQCGSCVAFATVATIETCFKKLTGVFGDYSEQELVDCGYRKHHANGCNGAQCYSYTKWIIENKRELMHESDYPYLNTNPKYRCPRTKPYRQGAKVTDTFYTMDGDEEMLKKLVYEHGAVLIAVNADNAFSYYGGGIFNGCGRNGQYDVNHAVAAVGYGTENGEDYWLIKNSWGDWWGEKGYIKLKRGVNACSIGWFINTVTCERVGGATDRPRTTKAPCFDDYGDDCKKYAKTNCKQYGKHCQKSCGLCKGMTPHDSNTCPDQWDTCKTYWSNYCHEERVRKWCCISCKGKSTCVDTWGRHCRERKDEFCSHPEDRKMCKKTCGLCR